jgi:uncharacterized protein (UPF0276 family)
MERFMTATSTRARRIVETLWSMLPELAPGRDTAPILVEWNNDVPPFPILAGEVARAEASLPLHVRRRHRRFSN